MCKIGDILLIYNAKNRKPIGMHPFIVLDDDNLTRMYLRGVFIACGSVNDPKTSKYHLELLVDTLEYAEFISKLLNDNYLKTI